MFKKQRASYFEWQLPVILALLSGIGLVVLYSAGFNQELGLSYAFQRQAASMAVGFALFMLCALPKPTFWKHTALPIFTIVCGLLVFVLLTGVVAGGARRWLSIGFIRIQPSEFMKLALILALARIFTLDSAPRDGYNLKKLLLPFVVLIIPVELIREQPDLGTALCHVLIAGSMLLVAGIRLRTFLGLSTSALLLLIPAWGLLHDYQKQRVLNFLSPERDPLGTGYHALQSKIAVGSGSIFGKGFMQGTQTQLRFLPEQTTDFIFSVLAEEWGFIGAIVVLFLYALLIYRILYIAKKSQDAFSAYIAVGVAALLFWQVFVNIGMVIGVLPVVGITLPLLSYGGSSVTVLMCAVGIVAGVGMRRYKFG